VLSVSRCLVVDVLAALAEEAELDASDDGSSARALGAMAPWLVRNYETFHQFIPIRSGFGLELYIGNSARRACTGWTAVCIRITATRNWRNIRSAANLRTWRTRAAGEAVHS